MQRALIIRGLKIVAIIVEPTQDLGQHLAVLTERRGLLGLRFLDLGQRLSVLVNRVLDIEHSIAERADSVVLLVQTTGEPGDFRASHAEQRISHRQPDTSWWPVLLAEVGSPPLEPPPSRRS